MHWLELLAGLAGLGREELARRFAASDRYLRESGVFYRVYEDKESANRAWPLAHVPLMIEAGEWEALQAGLIERASLVEAVLARHLRADRTDPRRTAAGSFRRRQSGFRAAARQCAAARRRASAILCGRRRARA